MNRQETTRKRKATRYMGSAVAGSLTASKWSTSQENSMFLSANFSDTTTIEDKQNEGGRQVTPESYAEHT